MSYLPLMLLILAMVIGIPIAYRAWREAHEEDEPVTDDDVLSDIERAYFAGEINEAEYRRVCELMGRPMRPEARASRPLPDRPAPQSPATDAGSSGPESPAEPT
jgi:hypothetical protein